MPANDPFMEVVKGRYPLSTNAGAARSWVPTEENATGRYVPRPDCSLSTLKWLSTIPLTGFLGIDHLYLRSPITAIAKLATFGGFGLWYLWDALQVTTESERVLNYGLTLIGDIGTGIGFPAKTRRW